MGKSKNSSEDFEKFKEDEKFEKYNEKKTTLDGWRCPVCGRGNSPFTSTCPCVQTPYPMPKPYFPNEPYKWPQYPQDPWYPNGPWITYTEGDWYGRTFY